MKKVLGGLIIYFTLILATTEIGLVFGVGGLVGSLVFAFIYVSFVVIVFGGIILGLYLLVEDEL